MDESKRPTFHRLANREAINMKASSGGKWYNNGLQSAVLTGALALNNPLGTIWPDVAQGGAFEFSIGDDAEPGGCDSVRLVANGAAITLSATFTWVNVGSDSIGTTNLDVNEFVFFAKTIIRNAAGAITGGVIMYSVKLNP